MGGRCTRIGQGKHSKALSAPKETTDFFHYDKIIDCKYDESGDTWSFLVQWNHCEATWEPEECFSVDDFTAVQDEIKGWKNLVRKSILVSSAKYPRGKKPIGRTTLGMVPRTDPGLTAKGMEGIPSSSLYKYLDRLYSLSFSEPQQSVKRFLPTPGSLGESATTKLPLAEVNKAATEREAWCTVRGADMITAFLEYSFKVSESNRRIPPPVAVAQRSSGSCVSVEWSILRSNGSCTLGKKNILLWKQ